MRLKAKHNKTKASPTVMPGKGTGTGKLHEIIKNSKPQSHTCNKRNKEYQILMYKHNHGLHIQQKRKGFSKRVVSRLFFTHLHLQSFSIIEESKPIPELLTKLAKYPQR